MSDDVYVPPESKFTEEQAIAIATRFVEDEDMVVVAVRHTSAAEYYQEVGTMLGGSFMIQFGHRNDDRGIPVKNVIVNDQSGEPQWFYTL